MEEKIVFEASNDVIDNISKKLTKPKFSYNENYTYEKLINNVKKNPFKLSRVLFFLRWFLILNLIYFLILTIFKKKYYYNVAIFIFFIIISLIITIMLIKRGISRMANSPDKEVSFYDDFFIVKDKNNIEKIFYKDIAHITELKEEFFITYNSGSLLIKTKEIDCEFKDFLRELKTNFKNKGNDEDDYFNDIDQYINKPIFYYQNNLNLDSLYQYYHTKNGKKEVFLFYLFMNFIKLHIMLFILYFPVTFYSVIDFDIWTYLFFMIFCFTVTIFCMNKYINYAVEKILDKFCPEKLYFYDNFLLVKTNFKIFKCDFENIKFMDEDDKFVFIKIKQLKTPIILEKYKLNITENKFLINVKKHTV